MNPIWKAVSNYAYVNFWKYTFIVSLCRIDLGKPDEPNQVELGRKDEGKVYKMFLDHTGEAMDSVYLQDSGWQQMQLNVHNKHWGRSFLSVL